MSAGLLGDGFQTFFTSKVNRGKNSATLLAWKLGLT